MEGSRFKLAFVVLLGAFLLVHPVYSNPVPFPSPPKRGEPNTFGYIFGVIAGEVLAWIVGAEFLSFLIGRKSTYRETNEISKRKVYLAMLVTMIVSFIVGNIVWLMMGVV